MSHLLETMNPEAVDRVSGPKPPGVGGWVVYIPRPGEGRGGMTEAPALILKERENGLDLLVFWGVDDIVSREMQPPISADHPFPGWTFVRDAEPEKFEPSRLNKIRTDLDSLTKSVLGEYNDPPKPVIDLLVDFESTLKEFNRRLKALGG